MNNLALARRQTWNSGFGLVDSAAFQIAFQHHLADTGCKESPILLHSIYSGDQVTGGIGFENETTSSRLQDVTHHLVRVRDG